MGQNKMNWKAMFTVSYSLSASHGFLKRGLDNVTMPSVRAVSFCTTCCEPASSVDAHCPGKSTLLSALEDQETNLSITPEVIELVGVRVMLPDTIQTFSSYQWSMASVLGSRRQSWLGLNEKETYSPLILPVLVISLPIEVFMHAKTKEQTLSKH